MKIAIISNLYPPFMRGGAEIVAAMEAQGLKKSWQHVFAISTRPAKIKFIGSHLFRTGLWTTSIDTIDDIDVYRFNPVNLYYYLDDFKFPSFLRLFWHIFDIFNIFSYFQVRRLLLKEKPDIVITHNLMGMGFLIPMLIRHLKIRHIHTVHDVQLVTPSGLIVKGQENAFSHRFFRYLGYTSLMKKLIGSPEIIISPSKFLLDFYNQYDFFPQSKKIVIPNPIRALIKIPKNPTPNLELVYLGQIHKAKGILDLIDSFIKIKLPHIRLHVIGIGADLPRAKHKAKDDKRIIFHGWLPNQKLLPVLSSMDVMLVPSLCYENSPTVIYESLSMGIPVLASDIGGASELIVESVNGWSFKAGDFDTLSKKIVSLYKQREKIAKMSDNCRASVKKYTLENYINKLLEIINGTN